MIARPEPSSPFDVEPAFRPAVVALLTALRTAAKVGNRTAGVNCYLENGRIVRVDLLTLQFVTFEQQALDYFTPKEPT